MSRKNRAGVLCAALTVCCLSGHALATAEPGRTEFGYASSAPVTSVVATAVTRTVPLPAGAPAHPAACDSLSYLRWRSVDGPADAADADRILVAQPGIFEGAGAFDSVARNTVARAAEHGAHIEFWALDRRSNCLEDHTGTASALRSGSFDTATDYYFHGAPVDGRRFAGYATGDATRWLGDQGLAQTLRDQYDLLRLELPDPGLRKRKVLCGGHSLGGFLTGYFAGWDFDGDPATTDDAGYNQCGGYFALDTSIRAGISLRGFQFPSPPPAVAAGLENLSLRLDTALPVLALPAVINPETTNLLALAGLAARLAPQGVDDLVRRLPDNANIALTLRTLLSQDPAMFATGSPDVRTLSATNEAVLGALLDDNSQPLGFLQASTGFVAGGPLGPKNFPLPDAVARSPIAMNFFGDAPKVSPTRFDARTVYRWIDYDAVGADSGDADSGDADSGGADSGGAITPGSEVTSIAQLARSLCESPLDFTEWYFPSRLALDLQQGTAPSIAAQHLHPDGIGRHPILTFHGSGGIPVTESDNPHDTRIFLPGYNHLDVLTAAEHQNNGRPEVVSTRLAEFATR
ncbi:hypothetical protein [Nocardia wallacei]|uniref:hypothetical protein n=1 Tax=Nocardia wallacei TaxID=480035 RepID=UPI00245873E1|nr:hypothetical protein [Nocardia wallacei]